VREPVPGMKVSGDAMAPQGIDLDRILRNEGPLDRPIANQRLVDA
jgi:hypothetical protein